MLPTSQKLAPCLPPKAHPKRLPLLYSVLSSGRRQDLRGEDYGLWSQKDMGWHHSKLLNFLEPQVNSSSIKWVNYSCSVMSQVVVSNALENAHKSAWHSSWHTVSAHSRQLYHFPPASPPSILSFLPSFPPLSSLSSSLPCFLPSILPLFPPSQGRSSSNCPAEKSQQPYASLHPFPSPLHQKFHKPPISKHTHIPVLPAPFSVAFAFPIDSGPGVGTNWTSRV